MCVGVLCCLNPFRDLWWKYLVQRRGEPSVADSVDTSLAYTERLAEIRAAPSIGSVGDSFDGALAETTNGLFKTELYRNPAVLSSNGGHWKGLDDLELATARWVSWFNDERLHSELDYMTPAEVEAEHYAHQSQPTAAPYVSG